MLHEYGFTVLLCIACTILLYILYFSPEGHYGITKRLLLAVFLACGSLGVHVLVTFQRRKDVQMFSELFILKSRPGTWEII